MYRDKNDRDHTKFSLNENSLIEKIRRVSSINLARIPHRDYSNSASILRTSIKFESNELGDEKRSSEVVNEVHRNKETL